MSATNGSSLEPSRGTSVRRVGPRSDFRLPALDDRRLPGHRVVRRAVGATLAVFVGAVIAAALVCAFVTIDVTVGARGTLEPNRIWPVRARQAGIIAEVYVAAGDTVRKGAPLLRLDSLDLMANALQLRSQLGQRRIEHEKALEAAPIDAGQRADEMVSAENRLMRARAALRDRMTQYGLATNVDSVLAFHRPGVHVQLDLAVADVRGAEADVRMARARVDATKLDRLERARRQTELTQLEDQIRVADERLHRLVVAAPADGIVLTERLERLIGAATREGESLLELADAAQWQVNLFVSERDVHEIGVGDAVKVDMPALHRLDRTLLAGKVISVASEPESAESGGPAGSYRVVAQLDRTQLARLGIAHLRTGYTVDGKVVTRSGRIIALIRDYFAEKLYGVKLS